jgi:hypothetical protein
MHFVINTLFMVITVFLPFRPLRAHFAYVTRNLTAYLIMLSWYNIDTLKIVNLEKYNNLLEEYYWELNIS